MVSPRESLPTYIVGGIRHCPKLLDVMYDPPQSGSYPPLCVVRPSIPDARPPEGEHKEATLQHLKLKLCRFCSSPQSQVKVSPFPEGF